jgi:hypothetical protein
MERNIINISQSRGKMSKYIKSILVFVSTGLLGPLIALVTYKYSETLPFGLYSIINDLLFSLFPAQMLAVVEVNIGTIKAAALAIGANMMIFGIIGFVAAHFAQRRQQLIVVYTLVCLMVFVWTFWGAGYSFKYLNWFALLLALSLYAVPFYIYHRLR